jgi:hypothetical protein
MPYEILIAIAGVLIGYVIGSALRFRQGWQAGFQAGAVHSRGFARRKVNETS